LVFVLTVGGCIRKHANIRPTSPASATLAKPADDKRASQETAQPSQTNMAPSLSTVGHGATTLTGCLGGSNGPTPYALRDERGRRYAVRGTKDLDNHVGRQVRLTGNTAGMTFNATKVEELAPSCTPLR
jgi:hypothetical protein